MPLRLHYHTCPNCGEEFECAAPIVENDGNPPRMCILEFEEGDQHCFDCREEVADHMRSEARRELPPTRIM